MSMESTVICVDNSEYSRNGDFYPDRLRAQEQAIFTVIEAKLKQNPESNVALISMGSPRPKPLSTLTRDVTKLHKKLFNIAPNGETDLLNSIRIARLILKHRESVRNQTRIVVFLCSPIQANPNLLQKLEAMCKHLKKEKIGLDICALASKDELSVIGQMFPPDLMDKDVFHYHSVDPSGDLSVVMLNKLLGQSSAGSVAPDSASLQDDDDPSLAMAIRMSLLELEKTHAKGKVAHKSATFAKYLASNKAKQGKAAKLALRFEKKSKHSLSSKSKCELNLSEYLNLLSLARSKSRELGTSERVKSYLNFSKSKFAGSSPSVKSEQLGSKTMKAKWQKFGKSDFKEQSIKLEKGLKHFKSQVSSKTDKQSSKVEDSKSDLLSHMSQLNLFKSALTLSKSSSSKTDTSTTDCLKTKRMPRVPSNSLKAKTVNTSLSRLLSKSSKSKTWKKKENEAKTDREMMATNELFRSRSQLYSKVHILDSLNNSTPKASCKNPSVTTFKLRLKNKNKVMLFKSGKNANPDESKDDSYKCKKLDPASKQKTLKNHKK